MHGKTHQSHTAEISARRGLRFGAFARAVSYDLLDDATSPKFRVVACGVDDLRLAGVGDLRFPMCVPGWGGGEGDGSICA